MEMLEQCCLFACLLANAALLLYNICIYDYRRRLVADSGAASIRRDFTDSNDNNA